MLTWHLFGIDFWFLSRGLENWYQTDNNGHQTALEDPECYIGPFLISFSAILQLLQPVFGSILRSIFNLTEIAEYFNGGNDFNGGNLNEKDCEVAQFVNKWPSLQKKSDWSSFKS